MAAREDRYPNIASISVVESAANTLTFKRLETGGVLFERRAFLIHQIHYALSAAAIVAAADSVKMGLATNSTITSIDWDDPNVLDWVTMRRLDMGTAASGQLYITPWVRDFATLPGGGLLVPSFPLYGFVEGDSVASAQTSKMRIYFTVKELSPVEYIELVEAMRVVV